MFTINEIVGKLLPLICTSTVDTEPEVRSISINCLEICVEAIKKNHRQLEEGRYFFLRILNKFTFTLEFY